VSQGISLKLLVSGRVDCRRDTRTLHPMVRPLSFRVPDDPFRCDHGHSHQNHARNEQGRLLNLCFASPVTSNRPDECGQYHDQADGMEGHHVQSFFKPSLFSRWPHVDHLPPVDYCCNDRNNQWEEKCFADHLHFILVAEPVG